MEKFEQTSWADPAYAREYLDNAEHYIPEREQLFGILSSFYRWLAAERGGLRICDLGCGDGVLSRKLLEQNPALEITLVDGSAEMLAAAQKRFRGQAGLSFLQKSFQDLLKDASELGQFDLVVSSFAIHHLDREQRRALFATVLNHLRPGGCLLNMDVALLQHPEFTDWHYALWQEWIDLRSQRLGLNDAFKKVPQQARENPDNKYSPLSEQLEDLSWAGFKAVECHYKNGLFAIYTGQKTSDYP